MEVAKVFTTGRSQAVRLPKEYRFDCDEVLISRVGKAVIIMKKEDAWDVFMDGLNSFSEDFMAEGRNQGAFETREPL